MSNQLEKIWIEAVVAWEDREVAQNIKEEEYPRPDSNPVPPEFKPEVLLLKPTCWLTVTIM